DCCGEPVVLFKDKVNFKLPGGAGFAPHQDAPAYVDFGVEHHLTLMVRDGVMERWEIDRPLAQPGDAIMFDAWVPHRSGPNRTSGPRRSYYLTFNPAAAGDHRAHYYDRQRECFPPERE